MAEKTSDEIMAEYLLKGARMLSRGCPTCGSPLFEVKGETRCVVCTEPREQAPPVPGEALKNENMEVPAGFEGSANLSAELSASLIILCRRVREEPDPERCLILIEAIEEGVEALRLLAQ
jgi:UPF0148 protein